MKLKKCTKCLTEQELSNFYSKTTEGRVNSWCKNCVYTMQRRRWIDRKIKAIDLLGGQCSKCGYNQNIGALDLHHVDPATKKHNWVKLRLLAWKTIVDELKKCVLLCRNCHAELHYPQLDKSVLRYENLDNSLLEIEKKDIIPTGVCPGCGDDVYGTKYCSVRCAKTGSRRVKRPSKKTLKKKIATMSWCAIGRQYGVSDNAIRKWARGYGILS